MPNRAPRASILRPNHKPQAIPTVALSEINYCDANVIHDLTGLIHTATAVLAIVFGSMIFLRPKGGTLHRRIGYVYTVCMIVMLVTSFMLYRLTGGFNVLHAAAILSSITLGVGLRFAILRRPARGWYFFHYLWMSWSYIGLLAAMVAELSTRLAMPIVVAHFGPSSRTLFWIIVGLASASVILIGKKLIVRHSPPPPA